MDYIYSHVFFHQERDVMTEYRTIVSPSSATLLEKKSEFIAQLSPIQTQEEALAFLENIRRQHRKARHNVYAYRLRKDNASRYSDDGEPQGTAGIPILDVLQKQGLTDICCVVTRYFGGILLGANGLVRAYSHSTAMAVENARICIMYPCYSVTIQMDYTQYGKVFYLLSKANEDLEIQNTVFTDQVKISLQIKESTWQALNHDLMEQTSGQIQIETGALKYVDFSEK